MIAIALPMVVSQACDTIMIFTDRLFLARLSPELMSAAMGGGLAAFTTMTFFLGVIGYSTALVAQYLGSGMKDRCSLVLTQTLMLAVAAYPLIILARPLARVLFEFMGVSSAQMGPQKTYYDILIFASMISMSRIAFSSFFSGIGRTRIVMVASFAGMIVNIGMNYILIYGKLGSPAFGIRGAAYGTIIGGVSTLAVLLAAYLSKKNSAEFGVQRSFRFDRATAMKLLRFGYPSGIEMFLNLVAFTVLVLTFHGHGAATAAAATIMFNWDLVAFVPLLGIEIGVTSLVGRYMGSGDTNTADRSAMSGLKLGMVYSFFVFILFVGFAPRLVSMFRPDVVGPVYEQAFGLAVFMVRSASLYVLIDAMIVAFVGALRGAGDTLWAMIITVAAHWATSAAAFISLRVFGAEPETAWVMIVCVFLFFSVVLYARYRSGEWKRIRVVETVELPETPPDYFHETRDL